MPETVYYKAGGGVVIGFDLDRVDSNIREQVRNGTLSRVNADGSPYGLPALDELEGEDSEPDTEYGPLVPDRNAPKAEFVKYAVAVGLTTKEDAQAMTRAELVEALIDTPQRPRE